MSALDGKQSFLKPSALYLQMHTHTLPICTLCIGLHIDRHIILLYSGAV